MDTKPKTTEVRASTLESTRFNVKYIEKERKRLSIVQFPLYSALGCLVPFLTAHMNDIGLTAKQAAFINTISALISTIGPLILGPIAHRYQKYNLIICIALILSTVSFTSLLFVPRVLRTEKFAQIIFDCTNGELLMERCQNWENKCNLHPKRLAFGNFTEFSVYQCRYHCEHNTSASRIMSDPVQVCFESSSEGTLCLEASDGPKAAENPLTGKILDPIKFDSRFDRWPLTEPRNLIVGNNHFVACSFQPNEAIIIKSQTYQSITCRPSLPQCTIHCRVDMLHRSHSILTRPLPCYRITGRPQTTFYAYLGIRCVADLCLFTGFALIDALAITLTNDFDSIYGRVSKMFAIFVPLIMWPIGAGSLTDYFSEVAGRPDYSPIFAIYNGFILITVILIACFPVSPILKKNLISYTSLPQTTTSPSKSKSTITTVKSSTDSKETGRDKMSLKRKIILAALLPFVLLLGTQWGLLFAYLPTYYINMDLNKMWLGIIVSLAFLCFAPFSLIVKSLTSGIGRIHLIVLGFIFYAIRLAGISFLHEPRWILIPFHAMEAFTLPLAWIGVTSYIHRLVPSSHTGHHLIVQYLLVLLHFGFGRSFGGFIWMLWLNNWEETHDTWNWLVFNWPLIQIALNYDISGYRLLLRLGAIVSAISGLVLLFFYHLCCRCGGTAKKPKVSRGRKVKKMNNKNLEETNVLLNGSYSNPVHQVNSDTGDTIKNENSNNTVPKQPHETVCNNPRPVNGDTNVIKMIDIVDDVDDTDDL